MNRWKTDRKMRNGTYLGNVTVRTAVEKSINTIAWKLYEELTPQVGLSYLAEHAFFPAGCGGLSYRTTALGGFTNGVSAPGRWQPDMRRSPMTVCTASRPVLYGSPAMTGADVYLAAQEGQEDLPAECGADDDGRF